jgi:hypothetical protein
MVMAGALVDPASRCVATHICGVSCPLSASRRVNTVRVKGAYASKRLPAAPRLPCVEAARHHPHRAKSWLACLCRRGQPTRGSAASSPRPHPERGNSLTGALGCRHGDGRATPRSCIAAAMAHPVGPLPVRTRWEAAPRSPTKRNHGRRGPMVG